MKNYRQTLNFILAVNLAVSVLSSEWATMLITMTALPPALLFVS